MSNFIRVKAEAISYMNEYVHCYYNDYYPMTCFISYKQDSFYYTTRIDKYTVYILSNNGSMEEYNGSPYSRDFHKGGINAFS